MTSHEGARIVFVCMYLRNGETQAGGCARKALAAGSCFQILEALAGGMGGLVLEELAATALLQGDHPGFGSRLEAASDLTEARSAPAPMPARQSHSAKRHHGGREAENGTLADVIAHKQGKSTQPHLASGLG